MQACCFPCCLFKLFLTRNTPVKLCTFMNGTTRMAFHAARVGAWLVFMKYLSVAEVDVSARDENGVTLIHVASGFYGYGTSASAVRALVAAGADVESPTIMGWRPLHSALKRGDAEVSGELLRAGARINVQNAFGRTPLCYADTAAVARLLLARPDLQLNHVDAVALQYRRRGRYDASEAIKAEMAARRRCSDARAALLACFGH